MAYQSQLALFSSLMLLLAVGRIAAIEDGDIAIYWGQGAAIVEGSLEEACLSENYDIIMLAFLDVFGDGQTPHINLADHCPANNCTFLSKEIDSCQKIGIKVLLSIGGDLDSYTCTSAKDARKVADYLWNNFLGGTSSSRPLGDAVLDGIDFYIKTGDVFPQCWDYLAADLSKYSSKVILTAAPSCRFPDPYLGKALSKKRFHGVFVLFPTCDRYSDGTFESIWRRWTSSIPSAKIFLGLPAAPDAAKVGYIPVDVFLSSALPIMQYAQNFGGVMLWSRYWDKKTNYSSQIRPYLHSFPLEASPNKVLRLDRVL